MISNPSELVRIALRASLSERQQNILWALSWSTPNILMFWKGTAMMATHRVKPAAGSRLKLSRVNLPAPPAVSTIPDHPPSMPPIIQNKESSPAPTKRKNCMTSVQITVRMPPIRVQQMAKAPMIRMQTSKSSGVTIFRARAATNTRTLCPRIPPI